MRVLASLMLWLVPSFGLGAAQGLGLSDAVVVRPAGLSATESNAVALLLEEVEKRSHIAWPVVNPQGTSAKGPLIVVGPKNTLGQLPKKLAGQFVWDSRAGHTEGYQISVTNASDRPLVFVVGNDSRGVLFGIGRLLRELHLERGRITLDNSVRVATSPKYPLRGHQLGYRPKCNSYDAWDLPVWEQYIRDLAVFGCNAIELIPPRSDDAAQSPHFPHPPMEMMIGMSRLADTYGLDVWIWYPAMDADYSNPKTVTRALNEWADVFSKLPRVDAVFVPGGDPGHTRPEYLMALLEKQTENLHRFHPRAQMWVSPQSFNQVWLDEFFDILNLQRPRWLNGIVFGPQVRIGLPELRRRIPAQYPLRHYPDITHSRQCQYPVPDWDLAYAVTEARECINPRPEDEATIFRKTARDTIGFITYSEGCNDDVNKAVWSALGWEPDANVREILRQYSRYFIGERYTDQFADGLLSLEGDWRGPLRENTGVDKTLANFQQMEKTAAPATLKNWRFQQALFRAYYDSYVRQRFLRETEIESQASEALSHARADGALPGIENAEKILEQRAGGQELENWRLRIFTLGEALFQSIGMQLSVQKYKASGIDRGASLDTLDFPLNNRAWLRERFGKIRELQSEEERLAALDQIVHWTDPGPGGFYDDLGNPARQPHLVRGGGFREDPGAIEVPRTGFEEDLVIDEPDEAAGTARRLSWIDHAETLYDAPLQMHYAGLDPAAQYKLRVVYGGDNFRRKIRLVANGDLEVHGWLSKPRPMRPLEFALPHSATGDGELTLKWFGEPGLGGNGRVCQLSEVWLLKETGAANH